MTIIRASLILSVSCILFCTTQGLAGTVDVPPDTDTVSLSPHLDFIEDVDGKLTIAEVSAEAMQAKFQKVEKDPPNFGFTDSVYWFRVVINNNSETIQWVIEDSYPAVDTVEFYQKDSDGNWLMQKSGDSEPFDGRYWSHPLPNFSFERWEGDTTPIFMRVQTTGNVKLPVTLYSERAFGLKSMDELFSAGIYYGIFIVMILFNSLMFVSLRDVNYLLYVGFLLFFMVFQMNLQGHAFEYLWPNSPEMNNLTLLFFIFAAMYCALEFSRKFNECEQYAPKFNKVLKYFGFAMLGFAIGQFIVPYKIIVKFAAIGTLSGCLLIFASGVACMKAQYRPARYFVGAWGIFLVGVILFALVTAGRIASNAITENAYTVGSTILVTFLALALVDRWRFQQEQES